MRLPRSLLRLPPWRRSISSASSPNYTPTDRVSTIVEDISKLTLVEVSDLTDQLRTRLGVDQMPIVAVMSPSMGIGLAGASRGRDSAGAGGAGRAAEGAEEKKEKAAFDLKLEKFDAAAKIKIIKEVRSFTDLGLKEAKELVEKAPAVIKTGVPKEEAQKIVEKMKELGAIVVLE